MKAEDYFERGNIKLSGGDLDGAIADYYKSIKLKPDYEVAYLGLMMAKSAKSDSDDALSIFDKFIEIKPDHMEAYIVRGIVKSAKNDLDGAIFDYDKAIELKPDDSAAYNFRGIARDLKGDSNGALADYDKAIMLRHDNALAYYNRGNSKFRKGDFGESIADYDKAIEFKLDHAESYNNRGIAKDRKGDSDGAIADYDKAIGLKPDFTDVYFNRGTAKINKSDLDDAIADFDKAIEHKPDHAGAYINRGNAKRRKGKLDDAIADYDKSIEFKPDIAEAYYNRGVAKSIKGDQDDALVDFDRANESDLGLSDFVLDLRIAKVTEKLEFLDERKSVFQLRQKVDNLLEVISNQPITEAGPMHYTNLNTLKNLVYGARFRLCNSSNMTDNSEGQIFFELLGLDKKTQVSISQTFGNIDESNVYLGSFVTDSHTDVGDDMMWRTYGKHEGKDNAGCALVFKKNNFADKWSSHIFHGALLQDAGSALKVKPVFHEELILFPVIYQSPITMTSEIKDGLTDLGSTLSKLRDIGCGDTIKLISDILGIVRFLFKNKKYSREQEARLVIWRKDSTGEVVKREPPGRKYIECPSRLSFYRVIIGQDVRNVEDWVSWVTTESKYDIDVKVSN